MRGLFTAPTRCGKSGRQLKRRAFMGVIIPSALPPAFPAATSRLSGAPARRDEAAAYQLMARSASFHVYDESDWPTLVLQVDMVRRLLRIFQKPLFDGIHPVSLFNNNIKTSH